MMYEADRGGLGFSMVRVCLKPAWRELIQEVKSLITLFEFEMRFTPAIEFLIFTPRLVLAGFIHLQVDEFWPLQSS